MSFHGGEDPVIREYYGNFERAGATLMLALGLFLVWGAVKTLVLVGAASFLGGWDRVITLLAGWGSLAATAISALQYVYAYLYPWAMARENRDD